MGHCLSVADMELGLTCPKCGRRGGGYEGIAYHCGSTYSIWENAHDQLALRARDRREAANPGEKKKRLEKEARLFMWVPREGSQSQPTSSATNHWGPHSYNRGHPPY